MNEVESSPLLTLPNELLEHIARQQDRTDFLALRITCRTVQSATRHLFLRECFLVGTIILQKEEMKDFATLLKASDVAQSIKRIRIYRSRDIPCNQVKDSARIVNPTLPSTGQTASEISNVLSKLPNVRALQITGCRLDVDFRTSPCICKHQHEYFEAIVAAAEKCGYRFNQLDFFHGNLRQRSFQVSKFAQILGNNNSLSTLASLSLKFQLPGPLDSVEIDEEAFASRLSSGLNRLNSLTSLQLVFENPKHLSHRLAEVLIEDLYLPKLSKISLSGIPCRIDDRYNIDSPWQLLEKHKSSLRADELHNIFIQGWLGPHDITRMLNYFRNVLKLDDLALFNIETVKGVLGLPDLIPTGKPRDWIHAAAVHFHSYTEVQEGVTAMSKCVMMDCSSLRNLPPPPLIAVPFSGGDGENGGRRITRERKMEWEVRRGAGAWAKTKVEHGEATGSRRRSLG